MLRSRTWLRARVSGFGVAPRALRAALGVVVLGLVPGCGSKDNKPEEPVIRSASTTGGTRNPVCTAGESTGDVQEPVFQRNLSGQTSWFAAPVVYDLDADGSNELIAAYYSLYVYDSSGTLLDEASDGEGRIYAPHVVADLDGDGITEIVVGNGPEVYAYEWIDGALSVKAGWPADTTTADNPPIPVVVSASARNGATTNARARSARNS